MNPNGLDALLEKLCSGGRSIAEVYLYAAPLPAPAS
jgi:hypothetical protein